MRARFWPVLVLGLGCKNEGCGGGDGSEWLLEIEPGAPSLIVLGEASGPSPLAIPLRAVNGYQIAVGATGASVEVVGSGAAALSYDSAVVLDSRGHGVVTVSSDAPQALTVTVTGSDDGAAAGAIGGAWLGGAAAADLGLIEGAALDLEPVQVIVGDGGVALVDVNRIWWLDAAPGSAPQLMAEVEDSILKAWGAHLDPDGVRDLMFWTPSELFMLRGHADGGYNWGAAFEAPDAELLWASPGDLDGDALTDIAIGYARGADYGIRVLQGDGVWGFTPSEPIEFSSDLDSVALGVFTEDGSPSVAVQDGEAIRRYGQIDGDWLTLGSDVEVPIPTGSRMLPSADITGDRVEDWLLVAPETDGDRALTILENDAGSIRFSLEYPGYHVDVDDVTGDGIHDLVLAEGGDDPLLAVIAVDLEGTFVHSVQTKLDAAGPVGAGDLDRDGYSDVAVFSEDLQIFRGGWDSLDSEWAPVTPDSTRWSLDLTGPMVVLDGDADGQSEVLFMRSDSEGRASLELRGFDLNTAPPALQLLSAVDVDAVNDSQLGVGLDLAVCGDWAWALVDDGGGAVYAVEIQGDALVERGAIAVDGVRVACGDFANGAEAAVATADGDVTWLAGGPLDAPDTGGDTGGDSGGVVDTGEGADTGGGSGAWLGEGEWTLAAVGSAHVDALGDIAAADLDGDGVEIHTCVASGCAIEAIPLAEPAADGALHVLVEGGASSAVQAFGAETAVPLAGVPSALDFDGDGRLDAALTELSSGRLYALPTLDGAVGAPFVWSWHRELSGPVQIGDVEGDGHPEAFSIGPEGEVMVIE